MDIPGILDFLKVLAANNNREWFQEHKAEYLSVQADFEELLAGVIARLSPWDESVAHVLPRGPWLKAVRLPFSSVQL